MDADSDVSESVFHLIVSLDLRGGRGVKVDDLDGIGVDYAVGGRVVD